MSVEARCGLARAASCGMPHVSAPCVLHAAQGPALPAHAPRHMGSASAAAQVDFGQASSMSAADAFVTAVLFAPDIAAQLFVSDAAFQARARTPRADDGCLHAACVLHHTDSPGVHYKCLSAVSVELPHGRSLACEAGLRERGDSRAVTQSHETDGGRAAQAAAGSVTISAVAQALVYAPPPGPPAVPPPPVRCRQCVCWNTAVRQRRSASHCCTPLPQVQLTTGRFEISRRRGLIHGLSKASGVAQG